MQLHPSDPDRATEYAVQSLAKGLIDFGYATDSGDLTLLDPGSRPDNIQKNEIDFATEMQVGDMVLVIVHQFPFALAKITSDYYYLRTPASSDDEHLAMPLLGVWFNHLRRVSDVKYYADWIKHPHNWETFPKLPTIQRLVDPESASYKLIERWLSACS